MLYGTSVYWNMFILNICENISLAFMSAVEYD